MSFDHLDDPQPPPKPSGLVVARIMAEGGRRLRHRRYFGAGIATAALVVGALGISSQLTGSDDDKVFTATPDSTTPRPTSTEEITSTTAGSAVGGNDQFAAIIQPNENALRVVLADANTGRVDRVLTEFPLVTAPWPCCVAWSPDRQTVYYVRPAGVYPDGHDSESIFAIPADGSGEPEFVTEGFELEISPDGTSLAYIRPLVSDVDELVLRDLATGDERAFEAPQGKNLGSVAWVGNGSVAYSLAGAGDPEAAYVVLLDDTEISLADGRRYGPPDDAPLGTRWTVHDNSDTGRALSIVEETPTGRSTFTADADGGRQGEVALSGPVPDASTDPSNTRQLLLTSPSDTAAPNAILLRSGTSDPTPVPLDALTIIAIDW